MVILDGKKTSAVIKEEIASEVAQLKTEGQKTPHLSAILIGNNSASETYIGAKVKACENVGFKSSLFRFPIEISEDQLLQKIEEINLNDDIDGLIVQLPLPKHISEKKVTQAISPRKDVDGFHPENLGKLMLGLPTYVSATPKGILDLIERYGIETAGKNCVVIGRSHIVGLPVSVLMARSGYPGNSTVTLCHSHTKNLKEIARGADILIAAIGKPGFVTADMVKEGAVVIDVGINRVVSSETKSGFKLVGDVDFDKVATKCSFITPVPGGVGPMTIVSLLKNTLLAAKGEIYR